MDGEFANIPGLGLNNIVALELQVSPEIPKPS